MPGGTLGWRLVAVTLLVTLTVGGISIAASTNVHAQFAACTAEPTTVAPGESVTLDASSSDANFVEFDKEGNGEYTIFDESDFIVEVTYDVPGTYQPTVRADGDSASTEQCGTITVQEENQPPQADLSISPRPGTVGEPTTFDATAATDSDGTIVEYRWDFDGDGAVDETTANPTTTFTFAAAGSYVPTVTVVDDDNSTDTAATDYRVEEAPPEPQARCSAEPLTVEPGETVVIDASASENASVVDFDVDGDGEYEFFERTEFTLEWSYDEPGVYLPRVRVHGETGTDTADCGDILVEAENQPPDANLSISPRPGTVGETVTFDASASTDSDGTIVEYRWDFDGDGTVDETTTDPTTTYTFAVAGSYVSTVTVADDENATATTSSDYRVEESSPGPQARCSVEPITVEPGETVFIDARASENAFFADFDVDGDGEYEFFERTEFLLEWSYDEPGTYVPRVRVHSETDTDTANCGEVIVEAENQPPDATLSIFPRPGTVGETVTFDASASTDSDGQIVSYQWDFDGNGVIDETTTDPTTTFTFAEATFYSPTVTVVDDENATDIAGADYRVEEAPPEPQARCSVELTTVEPGETVVIDARASENASVVDFDIDGDGEYEFFERTEFTLEVSYDEPGTYVPRVRVYAETGTATADCGEVIVEEQNQPLVAELEISPQSALVGETVTFDASNSSDPDGTIVEFRWDVDGDGTIEETTTNPTTTRTFDETVSNVARVTVVNEENMTQTAERDYVVEEDDENQELPLIPIAIGGGGLLGLGGLLWHFFGGTGGGGGGGDSNRPRPKRRPKPSRSSVNARYETGIFEIPSSSGRLSVSVGFEPDLVLFSATNAARTDTATDRTAGWSRGLATRSNDGVDNYSVTVADDGQSTDQATCATSDGYALQVIRHQADSPPGRVTVTLAETTGDGFEVDISVPGDDPLAGGIRVLYQAFRTATGVDIDVGHFRTPTEPGTQTVSLGIDADHVSLVGTAAVTEPGRLWTTDRGVGLTAGQAVSGPEDGLDQTAWGASGWPGAGHGSGAVAGNDRGLHLLYQDADTIAGRTRAAITGIDSSLRLLYDRVYNGPHKLGSTARHVVTYLAMAGGESMRPAVGAVPLPRPDEQLHVDCGFEPAMVEVTVSDAPLGEEVPNWATAQPFGWSHGTAIQDGEGLRQYVLHHAHAPATHDAVASGVAQGPGTVSGTDTETATDGGARGSEPTVEGSTGTSDPTAGTPESSGSSDESLQVPPAPELADDELVGLSLLQASDGTIVGREECRVAGMTSQGFAVTVDSVEADDVAVGDRPTLVYRAWPAVDGRSGNEETTDMTEEDTSSDRARSTQTKSQQTGHDSVANDYGSVEETDG